MRALYPSFPGSDGSLQMIPGVSLPQAGFSILQGRQGSLESKLSVAAQRASRNCRSCSHDTRRSNNLHSAEIFTWRDGIINAKPVFNSPANWDTQRHFLMARSDLLRASSATIRRLQQNVREVGQEGARIGENAQFLHAYFHPLTSDRLSNSLSGQFSTIFMVLYQTSKEGWS